MSARTDRRRFLQTTATAGALVGLGDLGFLSRLRPVSADEARLDPKVVRLNPEIEPLVRLLEETPRERLLEEVAGRIKQGTGYREVLAALLLAGVRNVQPRPSVGHKFHAVLVVNSAHLASLASPDSDRWLPIFWALDYFKSSQSQDIREGNWTMGPLEESAIPPARKAREAFATAMDRWDESAADAAVAGLARSAGANAIYEMFFRYGARDFRSIGHKAIYVANSYRTLQCIGWQHAEPVLRSLAYALLMHEEGNPADRDAPADRPWRRNQELARQVKEGWQGGEPDDSASADLMATLRQGSDEDACRQVVELLNRGVAPQSLWDGALRRGRRAADAPAGDRLPARGDHDERPAFRLPGERRRRDPPAPAAPERGVPAPLPRRDVRQGQGPRGPDRPARTPLPVGGRPGGHRGDLRRGEPRSRVGRARRWPSSGMARRRPP